MDKSTFGIVVVLAALGVGAAAYTWRATAATRTRERLVGTWRVDGSLVDWRFETDGTFVEDALIDTDGTFHVLDDGRIRIAAWSGTATFEPVFGHDEVLLRGTDGTMRNAKLVRRK